MTAIAWIAIVAIIIPNGIKVLELYLTHKKQAAPKPKENQRKGASHTGKIESTSAFLKRNWWRFLPSYIGTYPCVNVIFRAVKYPIPVTSRGAVLISTACIAFVIINGLLLRIRWRFN